MQEDLSILSDVETRIKALEEARRLRPEVAAVLAQLRQAKEVALTAEPGSQAEQMYLKEALEAGRRLAELQGALLRAQQEIRRTSYLVSLLDEKA